ncbi:MAG: hypothetical protein KJ946_01825, partial [Gammaproteobacteria bacterium]|nr:hypothetical protein [Gammaproteobacteria bacterium]
PEFPKIKRVGWAAKNSPRLVIFDFVFCGRGSNTFAADPPDALYLRRVCKGKKVKTSLVVSNAREPDRWLRSGAIASSPKYTTAPSSLA